MSKKVSKDEALKAVKTITKEISESSLEAEALEAVRTLILWAGDDPEREGLVDTPCLLYTSPSPRDLYRSRMPSSA